MNDEEVVQLIIKGVDQGATKLTRDVTDGLKGVERQAGATASGVDKIRASFTSLGSWIKAGIGIGIGQEIFHAIDDSIASLVRGFEGAIAGGQSWLTTVRDIQVATNMTAEQSSEWAAVLERMGVPLGNIQTVLSQIGKSLIDQPALWKEAGIATRDAAGVLLDTNTILTNLRQAFASRGDSLGMSGLLRDLVGRGGTELLNFLQLTNDQYKKLAAEAAAAGEVVTQQQVDQAHVLTELQTRVQGAVKGLQTAIFSGVAPGLMTFVDQFSNWIEANSQRIAAFVANVASFIEGVFGGLLGFDFNAKLSAGVESLGNHTKKAALSFADWQRGLAGAKVGEDALTTSVNAQIKAIDKQIASIGLRSDALHAAMERARLDESLATAQQQLADLKGNAPFTAGLSNAEAVLARQKHAQDIKDAQKAVADAGSAITMFQADQSVAAERRRLEAKKQSLQDELAAHKKAVDAHKAYDDYLTGVNLANDKTIGAKARSMFDGITAEAQKWRDSGVKFSDDLKGAVGAVTDAILGPQSVEEIHGQSISSRSGGLAGALGGLGGMMDKIKTVIEVGVAYVIARVAIGLAGAFITLGTWIGSLGGWLGTLGGGIASLVARIGLSVAALAGFILSLPVIVAGDTPQGQQGQKPGESNASYAQRELDYLRTLNPKAQTTLVGWDKYGVHPGMTNAEAIAALIRGGYGHADGGWLGMNGAEIGVFGEKEPELLIPKSKLASSGVAGGGTTVIHNHFEFLSMPSGQQLKQLIDLIDEQLGIRADNIPVGMPTFGPPG